MVDSSFSLYARYSDVLRKEGIDPPELIVGTAGLGRELSGRGYKRPWVLSGERTENALGRRIRKTLEAGGLEVFGPVLPAQPRPVASMELCEHLARAAKRDNADLIIAVGGGTLSDVGKVVSNQLSVPNWAAPTAPSVDAYTSGRSAVRIGGYHRTVSVTPSEVIAIDLEALAATPRLLIVAGIGDMLAKLPATADWHLASVLNDEPFNAAANDAGVAAARHVIAAVEDLSEIYGDRLANARKAVGQTAPALLDACLTSGLAMRAAGSSRPAATAEHSVAHFWEILHAGRGATHELHGILVTVALVFLLPKYEAMVAALSTLDERAPAQNRTLPIRSPREISRSTIPEVLRPFEQSLAAEIDGRLDDPTSIDRRRRRFFANRKRLLAPYRRRLAEVRAGIAITEELLGAPIDLRRLIVEERLEQSMNVLPFVRNRYGLMDLGRECGLEQLTGNHSGRRESNPLHELGKLG